MIMGVDKNIKNEDGQAIVEFLLFLPFMLMMYSVSMSISNAINASINQQKVTRSYFYYKVMNNSTLPLARRDDIDPTSGWKMFGSEIMGWAKELYQERVPVAPCFKFTLPLGEDAKDKCEDTYSGRSTQ